MSTTIKITKNWTELNLELTEADMREIGLFLRERVVSRTRSGVDIHGAAFKDYSPAYAERKREELGSASPVNLTVSGRMLNDLQVTEASNKHVTLGFVSEGGGATGKQTFIQRSRSIGAATKAEWNNPTREFMGASDDDEAAVLAIVDRMIDEKLSKL